MIRAHPSVGELVVTESNLLLKVALVTSSTGNHFASQWHSRGSGSASQRWENASGKGASLGALGGWVDTEVLSVSRMFESC